MSVPLRSLSANALRVVTMTLLWTEFGIEVHAGRVHDLIASRPELRLRLARHLHRAGDKSRAALYAGQATASYSQALFRNPKDVSLRSFVAKLLSVQGRYDEAARQLNLATDSQRSKQQAPAGHGGPR